MALPLYREVREQPPIHDPKKPSGHAGLWFERFYDRYKGDFSNTKQSDNAFRDWLACFQHLAGDDTLLKNATLRQSLLTEQLGGHSAVFGCGWHFVSGMGNNHPLENGFNWHPVWGVPYLPGSGLKGLVRAWVEAWQFDDADDGQKRQKRKRLLDWFGSVDKTPDKEIDTQTGKVIFFDAIPLRPVRLVTDIMTPHMGEWYAQGEKIQDISRDADKIPADWHSPNPIYFLSAKEPTFLVSVAPRDAVVAPDLDMEEVMQCVADALEWLGAGAKTAVGYGQFTLDEAATATHQKQQRQQIEATKQQQAQAAALQGLAGVALDLLKHSQQAKWQSDKNAFTKQGEKGLEYWLEQLKSEPHPVAVAHLRELFQAHFPGLLDNRKKLEGKKQKPAFSPRQQELAETLLEIEQNLIGQ